jgi:hypothetical protein
MLIDTGTACDIRQGKGFHIVKIIQIETGNVCDIKQGKVFCVFNSIGIETVTVWDIRQGNGEFVLSKSWKFKLKLRVISDSE